MRIQQLSLISVRTYDFYPSLVGDEFTLKSENIKVLTVFISCFCQCSDVDECTLGSDDCDQICIDTAGSFFCKCYPGYSLSSDSQTCVRGQSSHITVYRATNLSRV